MKRERFGDETNVFLARCIELSVNQAKTASKPGLLGGGVVFDASGTQNEK